MKDLHGMNIIKIDENPNYGISDCGTFISYKFPHLYPLGKIIKPNGNYDNRITIVSLIGEKIRLDKRELVVKYHGKRLPGFTRIGRKQWNDELIMQFISDEFSLSIEEKQKLEIKIKSFKLLNNIVEKFSFYK